MSLSYEVFRYIFYGGMVASGIFLVLSVVLFFTLNIPRVISDLSGRTARKAIENIRMQNEQSGDKSYQSSAVNQERGKLTDKISKSGRIVPRDETPFGTGRITEKISTQKLDTELLSDQAATTVLDGQAETTLPGGDCGETAVLDGGYGETSVLGADPGTAIQWSEQVFVIEHEITFIHTNEVIA